MDSSPLAEANCVAASLARGATWWRSAHLISDIAQRLVRHRGIRMRTISILVVAACLVFCDRIDAAADETKSKGVSLSDMTWVEAKVALATDAVVVIPIGAGAKEHGPHLPLDTDFRQAEYYKNRVLSQANVVVAPTINYSFYPAFVEYPGSTSLSLSVARDLIVEVIRGIAQFGPRRFYVLNTGVSTNVPIAQAAALLALDGIAVAYLDLTGPTVSALERQVEAQKEGTHADEIETSEMLAIDASVVDMRKAAVEYRPGVAPGALSLDPKSPRYDPSGIYGDATLATVAKGRVLVDGMTQIILNEIEALRRTTPPNPVRLFGVSSPPTSATRNPTADAQAPPATPTGGKRMQ
jgi:creatinine amidohydrolase